MSIVTRLGTHVNYEVFISYARGSARQEALALRDALQAGGHGVFLDAEEIAAGAPFPEELAAAVENSRVVVVLADSNYFTCPWCVREFEAALNPSETRQVLVAAPAGKGEERVFDFLPPELARRSWPPANDTPRFLKWLSVH